MKLEITKQGDVAVAAVAGELDVAGLSAMAARIDPMLAAGDVRWVLDLAGLQFMNSSALGYLITMSKKAKVAAGGVVVARPSAFVARVVMTLGVGTTLPVFPTVEAAVAHFEPRAGGRRR